MNFHVSLSNRKDLSGQIYRQIRRAIADGRLRPGDRLPASRDFARFLGVSRTTVTVAYDRLAGERLIVTRVGAGCFVSQHVTPRLVDVRRHSREGVIRSRAFWNSIPLSRSLLGEAQFEFCTGLPDASLFPHDA